MLVIGQHNFYPPLYKNIFFIHFYKFLFKPWVEESLEGDHLLAAVLASLCASSIRLTSTLPVTLEGDTLSDSSPLSPDPNHDSSPLASNEHTQEMSPGIGSSEVNKCPVLVDCITVRTEVNYLFM